MFENFKTDLSKFDNNWYNPQKPFFVIVLWYIINLLIFNNGLFPFSGFKCFVLRIFGAKIGKGVVIKPSVNIKYPWLLQIGNYCWIGERVWIDNLAMVSIGNHVCISQGAMLLTGNHNFKSENFELIVKGITLEDGVWIAAKSVVCPGITCYSHSVLTVGSVAKTDLEAYFVYGGNPAVKIKSRI